MKHSPSIRFALVLTVVWLAIGSDCCPPRERTDKVYLDSSVQNLVQEVNTHFLKRITQYFRFGGILQAIHEKYPDIPRAQIVKGGPSQFQDQSSGKGNIIHASHFIRAGEIHEKLEKKNKTLNTALKNLLGKTEDMDRCWNDYWSIGGKVDKFQSSNLTDLAKINFTGAFVAANKQLVVKLADYYQQIMNEYDRRRSDTPYTYETWTWTITNILDAGTIKETIKDGAILFQEGKEGYQSVNDGTFAHTWTKGNKGKSN